MGNSTEATFRHHVPSVLTQATQGISIERTISGKKCVTLQHATSFPLMPLDYVDMIQPVVVSPTANGSVRLIACDMEWMNETLLILLTNTILPRNYRNFCNKPGV